MTELLNAPGRLPEAGRFLARAAKKAQVSRAGRRTESPPGPGQPPRAVAPVTELEASSATVLFSAPGPALFAAGGTVSGNVESVFGIPAATLESDLGTWLEHVHPADRARVRAEEDRWAAGGEPAGASVYRLIGTDGGHHWVRFLRENHESDAGSWSLGIALDVTAQEEARRAAERRAEVLQAVFDASPDPLVVVGPEGTIVMASAALSALTGRREAPASLFELVVDEDAGVLGELLGRSPGDQTTPHEARVRVLGADGATRVVEIRPGPFGEGRGPAGMVLVLRDVSRQVREEDERCAALRRAAETNHAKSEFLTRLGHELRTPLNAVLGFAKLLGAGMPEAEQAEAVRQIESGGRHLLSLLDDVSDIARVEARRLPLVVEPVRVGQAVADVVGLLAPLAAHRSITVRAEVDPALSVLADRRRLRQVLVNLMANAIKYNALGGAVEVSATPVGRGVRIVVHDTGPGIAPDDVEAAFAPFRRLANGSGVEGAGIGLPLSRALVVAMGGELAYEGGAPGATFVVQLPAGTAAAHHAAAPAVREAHPATANRPRPGDPDGPDRRKRVLYVEDSVAALRAVESALDHLGGAVLTVARQGHLARSVARAVRPDVVLVDLHLPDMAPEELIGLLRGVPDLGSVPIAVVGADLPPGRLRRLEAAGASTWLPKPVEVQRLAALLALTGRGPESAFPVGPLPASPPGRACSALPRRDVTTP